MTIKTFPVDCGETVHHNLNGAELVEHAISGKEGRLSATGAFVTQTGQHTGRSASDKFVVRDNETEDAIWWSNSKSITSEQFDALYADFMDAASKKKMYVQDLFAGADLDHRLPTRIHCEFAWHALFIRHLLRRPEKSDLTDFAPEFTVVNLPSFRADPARHGAETETIIACDFTRRIVLIGGTSYAGETKKSVFSFLNYLLPSKGVMPMHCSANVGDEDNSAVFFGLSGTGKTTLSADPGRTLIGDDEHGWSDNGIFNFEGGCYAKTIRLTRDAEPEIFDASNGFSTVLENVILDENRVPDFDDGSLTENTRSAYPLNYISNASSTGRAGHPKNIVMLTADAFGVLPPIAKMTPSQAMYHFLSGYTAKVAGTEKGVGKEPQATFSTCFGAPFMPLHPSVYGNLLRELIAKHSVDCWLVNTGWSGGKYGVGKRMPLKETRALLNAALDGSLTSSPMRKDPVFGFDVPTEVPGVTTALLDPRSTWTDVAEYDKTATAMVDMFAKNFAKFAEHVDQDVLQAGPIAAAATAAE
ncbi:MAG: phosphoenolpyruvate carboxykinase [Hyphomicrobiaceae bacterium]